LLACPHQDCVERNDLYKNVKQHFSTQHGKQQQLDIDAAKFHTLAVRGRLMEHKILLANESTVR
jgi:hypothetical protein